MMPDSISDRVLRAWERGAGQPAAVRAALALEIISPADHSTAVFARDDALMRLRMSLLGPQVDAIVRCPGCDTEFDLPLDLSALASAAPEAASVPVETDGFVVLVRPPAAQDLEELPTDLPPEAFAAALFLRCVQSATHDGHPVGPSALPPEIRTEAAAALTARGMESPSADLTCGECGHRWRAPLDIASVLSRDIDTWALRQLDEVHRIASAYHWSEQDILALSPARRRFYLDAIG
jgi:hypothetical protein